MDNLNNRTTHLRSLLSSARPWRRWSLATRKMSAAPSSAWNVSSALQIRKYLYLPPHIMWAWLVKGSCLASCLHSFFTLSNRRYSLAYIVPPLSTNWDQIWWMMMRNYDSSSSQYENARLGLKAVCKLQCNKGNTPDKRKKTTANAWLEKRCLPWIDKTGSQNAKIK